MNIATTNKNPVVATLLVSCFFCAVPAIAAGECAPGSGENVKFDIAAYVWPAYHPAKRWAELGIFKDGKGEWQNVYEAVEHFPEDHHGVKPLWGYENEADPVVVARKIDASLSAGVNVFIYDWYWYGGRPFLEEALENGFLKAQNRERMRFYVMYANHNVTKTWNNKVYGEEKRNVVWPAKITDDDWKAIVACWVGRYFSQPNYYTIKGRPVVSLYDVFLFVEWEGLQKANERIDYLRAEARRAGFPGVHLQACAKGKRLPDLGFDSVTIYNWNYRLWPQFLSGSDKKTPYRLFGESAIANFGAGKAEADEIGATYFPNITCGWDNNARFPAQESRSLVVDANPEDFERFCRITKEWALKNIPADMPRLITVNSLNEWTEGSYLEPDDRVGYGYLNALWRVFVK